MRRLKKRYWLPPLIILVVFVAGWFALDPIVEWQTQKRLEMVFAPRYEPTFEDASLSLIPLRHVMKGLKVKRPSAGGNELPYIEVKRVEAGIYGKELLHGHLVVSIEMDNPRLNLIAAKQEKEQQLDPKIPDIADKLAAAIPLTVDRIQIRKAALLFTDKTNEDFPKVWIHEVDGTLENLSTRAALARGEPTSIAISGTLQESGQLSLFLTADPLAKGLFFAGRANVQNFDLKELSKTMASETGLTASQGTLDLFAEFDCRAGKLEGGIKPVLKNVEVEKAKPGLGNSIKAAIADVAIKVFSDRVGNREAVATVIPLRGDITKPGIQLWPAVVGVLRNAFVIGVSESYSRLPPPEEKKGPIKQLIEGLDKDKSPPAKPEPGRN